jgi:hypothetical protein
MHHNKVTSFSTSKQAGGRESDTADPSPNPSPERMELQRVLESRTFARSPRLARLLGYVCGKYFAGETDRLKEYTIGVELFGRSEGFQPHQDASIRVDMNRLRKQLRKYYRVEGKQDPLVISIPSGQYAPVFSPAQSRPTPTNAFPATEEGTGSHKLPSRFRIRLLGLVLCGGLLLGVTGTLLFLRSDRSSIKGTATSPGSRPSEAAIPAAVSPPAGPELRILAGLSNEQLIDQFGSVWLGDRYFTGGSAVASPPGPSLIFHHDGAPQKTHARQGDFGYHIPLRPGVYELRLYFMEWMFGSEGESGGENFRIFDVFINGNRLLPRFDIVTDAGGARVLDVKVFTDISPASDGLLHLTFVSRISKAILSGIEVLPGIPGKIRPVRIACRTTPYTALDGTAWSADRYFRGGRLAERHISISGTADPVLHVTERYGHFSYTIPVANHGLYTVILGFAETYFGEGNPGGVSRAERLFNVQCNGHTLLKDFSILRVAGSANRVITRVFQHIEPSPQGKIILDFVPVRDYACVNTIQVMSE